jgi:hypothetical protein
MHTMHGAADLVIHKKIPVPPELIPSGSIFKAYQPYTVQGHFAPELKSFILYQYFHCHVTQPLLPEQLRQWKVDISSGQLNRSLTENKDIFHNEKDAILEAGLKVNHRHIKIATEGALIGSVLHHGLPKTLVIVSDDAGQFNILTHALCWIHAERTLAKLGLEPFI